MTKKQPNILLIISDQWSTRIADGSGNNFGGIQTPTIDKLAAEGTRFTQSYASFPLCCPARSTMFTGLMPHNHNFIDNEEIFIDKQGSLPTREDVVTMGQAFKDAGYQTAYFGKEHAGNYGWDSIDEYGTLKYSGGGMLAEGSSYDPVFTRDAIDYLQRDHERPFYMVLSLINPHDICKVLGGKVQGATIADAIFFCRTDDELYLRYQTRPGLPENFDEPYLEGMLRHQDYMYEELGEWSEDDWRRYIAAYGLLLENTDWNIKLLLDALHHQGLDDETIVIFTTDHGEMLGSHRMISKVPFYEESAKTMMVVKQPGVIPAGAVNNDAFIGTADLMPTMLDLCGVPVPDGLDGRSFKPQCFGQNNNAFPEVFSVNQDGRMLRFGTYKYVRSQLYGQEYDILFDLEADPNETKNLFNQPGYEQISTQASQRMTAWLAEQNLNVTYEPV